MEGPDNQGSPPHQEDRSENGVAMTEQMPSMTLEEAKIKFANCWRTMMAFTVSSDHRSFADGYQCAIRDCFPEYFLNVSPKQVTDEVKKMGNRHNLKEMMTNEVYF